MATHTYQDKYYDYIDRGSTHSATRIIPMMQAMIDIRSVLDVGCGRGAWLAAWCGHGVDDIVGIDGDYIERDKLPFAAERFIAHDLTRGFLHELGRQDFLREFNAHTQVQWEHTHESSSLCHL